MLKIQFKDRRKPAMWLVDSSINLGSGKECDIVIDDSQVDDIHASLLIDHDDITLTNRSKNKSIFVNDIPVVQIKKLVAWDVIRIGNVELEIIDPLKEAERPAPIPASKTVIRPAVSEWILKANSAPLVGQFFQISHGVTIGRDESADIVIPLSLISRFHARLSINKGKMIIEDTNSSNGTYVNGERITSCELRNNDEISFDEFSFVVVGPEEEKAKPRTLVRDKEQVVKETKRSNTKSSNKQVLASEKVFLHDIDTNSNGTVYEFVNRQNHLSKMLGHHLSTSEQSVSARHVYFNEMDLGWEVVNNGASDGLLINNKMQIRAVLQDGDEITVGGTKLKFQSVGDTPRDYFTPDRGKKSSPFKLIFTVAIVAVVASLAYYFGWFV